jgi:spore germination protein GerM
MHDDQHSHRSLPLGVVAGVSALILATGGGLAWWTWNATVRQAPGPSMVQAPGADGASPAPSGTASKSNGQTPSAAKPLESTGQVYWLKSAGNRLELAASPVPGQPAGDPNTVLKTALENLLAGPGNSTVSTTIPAKTQLRSVVVKSDGIHVDLSQEFTTGGGSASMKGRVAQVLYTATSLNPTAKVWLSVEGRPLDVLGGEGLMLDQPLTRQTFEQDFPL